MKSPSTASASADVPATQPPPELLRPPPLVLDAAAPATPGFTALALVSTAPTFTKGEAVVYTNSSTRRLPLDAEMSAEVELLVSFVHVILPAEVVAEL